MQVKPSVVPHPYLCCRLAPGHLAFAITPAATALASPV